MLALARTETTGLTGEMKGTLRVHTTPGVGLNLVVPAAIEFAQTHASVTVDLTVGELPLDLTNKRLDLVIASRHFGEDDPKVYSTMASRNLGAMPYVICASPNYLLRHGTPETPRQLAEHRCLVHVTQKRNPQDWSFGPKEIRYVVRVKEAFRSNIESAILMAALQGAGIARLPEYIARRDLNAGNLRVLFPGAVHSGRLVKAFFPRSKHIPRKVRLFIDLVDKRYEKSSIDS
jgi:DNA-binding transcriptional LysR family regulator